MDLGPLPPLNTINGPQVFGGYMYHQELGFNADVLPAPTVGGLSVTSGPAAGGTKLTIIGTNFVQVSKVGFGSVAAATFKVEYTGTSIIIGTNLAAAPATGENAAVELAKVVIAALYGSGDVPGGNPAGTPPAS